ncbi:MAG: DUF1127 domain-containing protein [Stellaceae bacterium]
MSSLGPPDHFLGVEGTPGSTVPEGSLTASRQACRFDCVGNVGDRGVRRYSDVRAPWVGTECCPAPSFPTWRDRLNLISAACRWAARYGQCAAYEQLDDHLLDDIGIDEEGWLRRSRQREAALRRVWLAGFGGFL